MTAGNASTINDGAAAVTVMPWRKAKELGLEPMARIVAQATSGVDPKWVMMAPVEAVEKLLAKTGWDRDKDVDLIELNEAFAAQALAVIRTLEIDPDKVNVNGGAIALGHPLGATGAILTAKLLGEMKRRHAKYGLVTMCIGGGMGAAGIFENLQ